MTSAMVLLRNKLGQARPRARGAASIAAAAAATALVAMAGTSAPAAADVTGDRVASKSGSDTAAGTLSSPYRTAQKLVDSLSSGQTGCLRQGTYADASRLRISQGGAAGAPKTLR